MTTPGPRKRQAYEPVTRFLRPSGYHPDMPRPFSTVAGAALVVLRVLAGVVMLVGIAAEWDTMVRTAQDAIAGLDGTAATIRAALWLVLAVGVGFLAVDAVLAVFIYRGHNWARMIVMLVAVLSISSSFATWWAVPQDIPLNFTFVSLSLDILVLLALSSRSAAAYARRNQRPDPSGVD